MKNNIKEGFTLAEVLVVLAILGVIAVMTIPSLIANANEQVAITGVKKAFATVNNAITLAGIQEGESPASSEDTNDLVSKVFKPTVKIGQMASTDDTFFTQDGMVFHFEEGDANCGDIPYDLSADNINQDGYKPCAYVVVDINGTKGPNKPTESNQKGKIRDQFTFAIYNNGATAANTAAGAIIANGALKMEPGAKANQTSFDATAGKELTYDKSYSQIKVDLVESADL